MPALSDADARQRVNALREAMPSEGMFKDKEWLLTPQSFPITVQVLEQIQALGPALLAFQKACDQLYHASAAGTEPGWIAQLLDKGKPPRMIEAGRHERWRTGVPGVLRPDLILTETGLCVTELDSLPGGIGLTGWLGETFSAMGDYVIGGAYGMLDLFSQTFPVHDILVSRESSGYQPEMEWLAGKLREREGWEREVLNPWNVAVADLKGRSLYRFFELWDIDNVEQGWELLDLAMAGEVSLTPPPKAHLEEKLWLALFWMPGLRHWWEKVLIPDHLALLEQCIPQGWTLDPAPLPVLAEYPWLGIQSWQEMKRFGNKERELVVKISGYSEKAWGSRGVSIGHDLSQEEWSLTIDRALTEFPHNPYVLQRFHRGRVVQHPVWDEARQSVQPLQGRVRLCPYFFVNEGRDPLLGGILATIVPADKKILHGMRDGALAPCALA